MRGIMKIPVVLMTLFLVFHAAAFADMICLNDGMSFEGKIIGFEGNAVRIKTADDIFMVDEDKIKSIEKDKEEDEKMGEEYPVGPGSPKWNSTWE